MNFKTTKNKPAVLKLFHECVGPEELRMLFGREGGRTYYSTVDLTASHSANAVVLYAASLQDAYCRMPLLTTPSVPCADFGFHAEEAPLIPCSRHTLASQIDSTQAPFFLAHDEEASKAERFRFKQNFSRSVALSEWLRVC